MAIKTFTSGSVLTASDTNTYLANSGLVYVTGGALSGTATDFVGCFTSDYDNYRIEITTINTTAGWLSSRMLVGTTPLTGSYYMALPGRTSGGVIAGDSAAAANMAYMSYVYQAGGQNVCNYDIMTPQKTTNTFFLGQYAALNTAGGTYNFYSGGIAIDNATSYNGLRILHSASATLSGNVRIYGYRQA